MADAKEAGGRDRTPEGAETAVRAAEDSEAWWTKQWLLFPTVSRDQGGAWHYWAVPTDTGVYSHDWAVGEGLARDTVAQMQRFEAGSTVLRRIMREIDFNSTVAQGFLTRIEDMLTNPGLYLESLEPGAVRAKLRGQ
ncbi:MAG: hypothetical protein ACE5KF_08700 [Kiloniellaceae bacterium]